MRAAAAGAIWALMVSDHFVKGAVPDRLLRERARRPVFRFPFNIAASLVAAALSYHLLEMPMASLRSRFRRVQPAEAAMPRPVRMVSEVNFN
jgi:peptidoglycan/LPS O-acetylase OafA/YrhL